MILKSIDGLSPIHASALDQLCYPRHRWYFYKEAFSPALVRYAIEAESLDSNAMIFDPFCGSGTTLVEACVSGLNAIGYEVNPFVSAVTRAKLSRSTATNLRALASDALGGALRGRRSPLETFSTFSQTDGAKKWLFNTEILRAFSGAMHAVASARGTAALPVRIALIGAAMDCSNARKDGKCLRYRNGWETSPFGLGHFLESFGRRISLMAEDLETSRVEGKGSVSLVDARNRSPRSQVDFCLTSPPYLNSFDYTDVYRPELFLGGFVTTMDGLSAIRHRTLRSHVQVKWRDPSSSDFGASFADTMRVLGERRSRMWNNRIPLMVQAYFEDLQTVLSNMRRALRRRGSAWLVVSTSSYAGHEIPVADILAEIAERNGWVVRDILPLRQLDRIANQQWHELRASEGRHYLRESIVVLSRPE